MNKTVSFEKFGKHGYVSQSKVVPLLSFLQKGELAGTKCKRCATLYFPPRADCPRCRNSTVDWVPINSKCKLVTYTEVHFGPPEFQQETPYLLGVAEMNDGPRVFAPISRNIDKKQLRPGLELTLKVVTSDSRLFYQLEATKQ